MALYIDTSALVPLIVVEPDTRWAQATILPTVQERYISDFGAAEVASAISRRVRMGQITADAGRKLLLDFDVWTASDSVLIETTAADVSEAGRLVRRFELRLRTPDALHLALATRHKATLVTRDQAMVRAAEIMGLPRLTTL